MMKYYTYNDIGLIPRQKSEIISRENVDLSINFRNVHLKSPIIGSPMDTVCNSNMAEHLDEYGGVGIIHRFQSIDNQKFNLLSCMRSFTKNKSGKKIFNVGIIRID